MLQNYGYYYFRVTELVKEKSKVTGIMLYKIKLRCFNTNVYDVFGENVLDRFYNRLPRVGELIRIKIIERDYGFRKFFVIDHSSKIILD